MLYVNFTPPEISSLEENLLQDNEEEDIPMISVDVKISSQFIHQRLSFFLELIAFCLNQTNSQIFQQDCKANLLSIWENIIKRVYHSLEDPNSKSEALHSIKQLIVFPFSYCKFLCCKIFVFVN